MSEPTTLTPGTPGSILGHRVLRTEDPELLTGRGRYTEDISVDGALHAVFVRSHFAHGRIRSIDTAEAAAMPGVVGVFTAEDLGISAMPSGDLAPPAESALPSRPPLARGTVRFVGEPVAVVLAETRAQAADAAEVVDVEVEPLPAVVDPLAALEPDAPVLHADLGTNVVDDTHYKPDPGALEDADVVAEVRIVNQRLAPVPMEPNGGLAEPDGSGGLVMTLPCQGPHLVKGWLAPALGLDPERLRVIAPQVGGGFGAKVELYAEQLTTAALALRLDRPVRYVETRSENLVAMTHGRAQVQDVQIGAKRDGTITGLRVSLVADMGAYPEATFLPSLTRMMACGVYTIPRVDFHVRSVVTNTTPIAAYRGAGRPEAAAMIERTIDVLAGRLGMDPVEVRRRNLIPPDDFPHKTVTGARYDSGNYERALDVLLEVSGYQALRREQAERRARDDRMLLGLGLSTYVEITGFGTEFGRVEVSPDGSVTAYTGTSPHGQGHETAFAQIVSATLGVEMDRVRVIHGDTALVPRGQGTMGSRSLQVGGSAILRASEAVLDKAKRVVAHTLEASPEDIVPAGGGLGIAGAPRTAMTWAQIAAIAGDPARLPEGLEPGLDEQTDFDPGGTSFPFGAHLAVVEVDSETGDARLVRMVVVDDCGHVINPVLVEGQVHGGLTQGIAQALFEGVSYDEDGNPLSASLTSYEMPSAAELPSFETHHTETPSPLNPLGAKGIGESATIGSTPAVQNAVVDAVAHLGVTHLDMPLGPERVWKALQT